MHTALHNIQNQDIALPQLQQKPGGKEQGGREGGVSLQHTSLLYPVRLPLWLTPAKPTQCFNGRHVVGTSQQKTPLNLTRALLLYKHIFWNHQTAAPLLTQAQTHLPTPSILTILSTRTSSHIPYASLIRISDMKGTHTT